jgi:hypothetical protein
MEITQGAAMDERAYEAAIDIIKNHQPYPLPEAALDTMDDIVMEFEKELGIAQ